MHICIQPPPPDPHSSMSAIRDEYVFYCKLNGKKGKKQKKKNRQKKKKKKNKRNNKNNFDTNLNNFTLKNDI